MKEVLDTTIPIGNLKYIKEKLGDFAFGDAVQAVVTKIGVELAKEISAKADSYPDEWYQLRIEPRDAVRTGT